MTTQKVSFPEKICFGFGDVGCVVIWNVVGMFLTIYYTDSVGISAAAVAAIMLSVRIFDGFSDLVFGYVLDKTNSKLGKARPWILWSAPFMAGFLILCFAVPESLSETAKVVYAFITYFFLSVVVYTACNLSYCALTSFITDSLEDRASCNSIRFIMTGLLSIVLGYVTPVAQKALGWTGITVVYGLIALVLLVLCFAICKERVKPQERLASEKVGLKESVDTLVHNKFFYFMLAFFVLDFINLGLTGGGGMYLARWVLKDDNLFGDLTFSVTIGQIVGALALPYIMNFIGGKWNAIIIGYALFIVGYGVAGLATDTNMVAGSAEYYTMLLGNVIQSVGRGFHFVAMFAMVADVVEYGEWKTGRRLEGATYSVTSFGFKIGIGVGGALVGLFLSMVNYDANLVDQPESTLQAILVANIWAPVVLSVVGLIISLLTNLDKIYPTVKKELEIRRAQRQQLVQIIT